MNVTIKRILISICMFIAILFISTISNAGDLKLKTLNYDVKLNADGTADVVETWKIYIEDTNTLFKTFEIDKSKYKEITDVKVAEIKSNGNKTEFTKTNEYKYHVDKNYYYALIYNGKFEIAWGAHAEDTTRTYQISYKIVDAIKNYNDCSEFYWQFISTESEIPANLVTGTIRLPIAVANKEDLKVWAHGPLNGNIEIQSNDTVVFEVESLKRNTMLEARVVTNTSIFYSNLNTANTNKLSSILEQEQKWADEANALREKYAREQAMKQRILKIVFMVLFILEIILGIFAIKKIIKYHKELKDTPQLKPDQESKYYRDIPNERATPAQAAFLYYFKNSSMQINMSKIISATMLDLCMKKYIEFEVLENKKNQIKVILKPEMNKEQLSKDEKIVYEIFEKVAKSDTNSFTMKDFEKYAKNHSSSLLGKFNKIELVAKEIEEANENYDKKLISTYNNWVGKGVAYILLAMFIICAMVVISVILFTSLPIFSICAFLLTIPSFIAGIYCFVIGGRYNRLTQKGINEKEQWMGLKRYMDDFSMIDDKTVPELVIWEKYLVFATAFGIADKVLKQLKVVYPQIADTEYMRSHGYTYMYLMYSHNINNSFISTLNNSVSSTYNSVNYSSGSGSGGGFSGGGGFGGGGGRNGRKIKLLSKSDWGFCRGRALCLPDLNYYSVASCFYIKKT